MLAIKKNDLYKQFLKKRCNETEQCYKKYKNRLTTILRNAEREYYRKLLENQKQSCRETWNFLRGGGVLVEKLFCSFFNTAISLYIYYDQYEQNMEKKSKKLFFPLLVYMEMAAIFDFRALTKVHLTSKPLLQMQ